MGLTEHMLDKSADGFLRLLPRYGWPQIQTHEFLSVLQ